MSIQNVNFSSVNDFLDYLPKPELEMVQVLRGLVDECLPHCREKLSYNVPFYSGNKRICFIWPSSITWGKVQTDGVMLGFCQGHLIDDDLNYLEKGDRKMVITRTFLSKEEIHDDLVRTYLFKAAEVDALMKPAKRK